MINLEKLLNTLWTTSVLAHYNHVLEKIKGT